VGHHSETTLHTQQGTGSIGTAHSGCLAALSTMA
jgi:hypothetical protein